MTLSSPAELMTRLEEIRRDMAERRPKYEKAAYDLKRAKRDFDSAAAKKGLYSSQYRLLRPDGAVRHVRTRASHFQDIGGTPKMIGAEWDVTSDVLLNETLVHERQLSEANNAELKLAKAHIEHAALHDSLTGCERTAPLA